MSTARLELVVTSSGIQSADKDLKQLTATAKETEKQQKRMAEVFAEVAAAEEKACEKAAKAAAKLADDQSKAAKKASDEAEREAKRAADRADKEAARQARQLARENEQWNDALQKAIARNEKRALAAEKAAKREEDAWNNAIQRAKAGLDGVLPIRPSLQRIEAQLGKTSAIHAETGLAKFGEGAKEGAMAALGVGALAGGAAGAAAAIVEGLAEKVKGLTEAVIENLIEDDKLVARLGGVTDSAEAAGETFEDLQKQTFGKLPSKIDEVANAFIQLGNNGLQNGQVALKAYSNIAAQTGSSLTNVTSAVQQATLGNYRSLREFGIKVKEEGDSLKVTFRGQTETIAGGADAIEQYMQRLGNVQFAGAVERQMDTIGGTVKKTEDAWEKFINAVGDSSLGSLIQSSVGASISVIDAMTASVEALFDKAHKGARELESDRKRMSEQDKLDKTMMSWADPSVSKSETARLAEVLQQGAQSSSDKALAQYTRNMELVQRLEDLGETLVGDMTLAEARNELTRQYTRDNGGFATKSDYTPKIATGSQTNYAAYVQMVRQQTQAEIETIHASLLKKEDAAEDLYEHNKEILAKSTADETQYIAANEVAWEKHLAELQAKKDKEQLELQKRLQNIGIGPQSQIDVINRKYAGQRTELSAALADNLSGKNGASLQLEAEQTYADKSVDIEKARAREIRAINDQLAQDTLQNAEAVFAGLASALKSASGEQSAEYQAMFRLQQAFGIASATSSMFIDMAKANEAGYPASIPLYFKAAADGARLIAQISNNSFKAYDAGGNIPAGEYGWVAERRPEMLLTSPALVRGPATVVGGQATADMLSGRGQGSMRIVNTLDEASAHALFNRWAGSTRGQRAILNVLRLNESTTRTF